MKHILILIITFFLVLSCLSNNHVVKNDVTDSAEVSAESYTENMESDEIKPIDSTADTIIISQADGIVVTDPVIVNQNTAEEQSTYIEPTSDSYVEKNNEILVIVKADNEIIDIPVTIVEQTRDIVPDISKDALNVDEVVLLNEKSDQTDDMFVSEDSEQYNDNVLRYADLLKNYQLKQETKKITPIIKSTIKKDEVVQDSVDEKQSPTFNFTDNSVIKKNEELMRDQDVYYYDSNEASIKKGSQSTSLQYDIEQFKNITNNSAITENNEEGEEIQAEENSEINISLDNTGWIINKLDSTSLNPVLRKNDANKTWFSFITGLPGNLKIEFIRYDYTKNINITKEFTIKIVPKNVIEPKKAKKTEKKADTKMKDKDYKRKLADNFFIDGNYKDAIKSYEEIINTGGGDAELYYRIAKSYRINANKNKAIEYYKKNIAEIGNMYFDDAIIEFAQTLKDLEKYKEAIDSIYNIALPNINNIHVKELLYLLLGDLNFNLKNYSESSRNYKTFISLYNNSIYYDKALFYLAYSLELLDEPKYKEASMFYRELVFSFPESQFVNLSKSRILYLDRHFLKVN